MLARSRERARSEDLDNIEFVLGDTTDPRLDSIAADCIVVNMVLHHTPSPADIFGDLADCLAPGGVLLVTDLCRHDQHWAREACGDLWLGFDPAELTGRPAPVCRTWRASISHSATDFKYRCASSATARIIKGSNNE